jgi:hypothetical protein
MVGFVRAGVGCGRRVEASGLPGLDGGLVSGLLASLERFFAARHVERGQSG